jgi:hypothetical protein
VDILGQAKGRKQEDWAMGWVLGTVAVRLWCCVAMAQTPAAKTQGGHANTSHTGHGGDTRHMGRLRAERDLEMLHSAPLWPAYTVLGT